MKLYFTVLPFKLCFNLVDHDCGFLQSTCVF